MNVVPLWLHEVFAELNKQFFEQKLPTPKFGVNPFGGRFGASTLVNGTPMIWFHPRTLDQGRAFVADTLLHELIHCELARQSGDSDQQHGERFVELANQIARQLGLPAVRPGSDAAIDWPQSVRPLDVWR